MLFNGNFNDTNKEFDEYLNFYKYKFKEDINEVGGYISLKKTKNLL